MSRTQELAGGGRAVEVEPEWLATADRHGLARAYSPACAADLWALQARARAALGRATNSDDHVPL